MNARKKQIRITGYLKIPLVIGKPALVVTSYKIFCTANVLRIISIMEDHICFETRNNIYLVSYTQIPDAKELVCA